ncbi:MAG: hypothetical protein Q8S73_26330 [Deltaproteobacteria bacterium]|nr:hypothetical protein [Myxococcales bacterium]MDP3217652.1 hypothetical protein [Deltaproteobacteria bacterium]
MSSTEPLPPPSNRAGRFDFALAALPLAAVVVALHSYVPLWDGAVYLRCIQEAFGSQRGAAVLSCVNHPTGGYLGPLAVVFHLAGLRYVAVIAANALLALLATHAAADLSAAMFPGALHRAERALVALGFALCPLLLACTVQLTPDFGVAVFGLCAVRALARERLVLATLFGALTCFSKETGVVVYALLCAAYLMVYVGWATESGARSAALARRAVLALAFVPSGLWAAARMLHWGERAAWRGVGMETPLWRQVISVSWLDNVLPTQLAEIFLLNFGWVLSVFVVMHAAQGAWRWAVRTPRAPLDRPEQRAALFVLWAFAGTAFAVTRIRTFAVPRYLLPAVVMLPLMGQVALHALGVQRRMRLLVLGLFAALSAVAALRSQDGLSLRAFGSFPFGDHHIVDLSGWTGETPNRRDHIVYNLEFTRIAELLDDALPYALGDGRHALALNRRANWWLVGCVDPRSHRRVVCTPSGLRPAVVTLDDNGRAPRQSELLYYIELPGMDDEDELIAWAQRYRVGEARRFTRRGYAIAVRELRLREDAPPPAR